MKRQKLAPRIRRDEYDAFCALINEVNFPDSFDAWLEHRTKHDAHNISQGSTIQEIVIHPEEFADWCRRSGLDPSFHTLYGFTVAKARRED